MKLSITLISAAALAASTLFAAATQKERRATMKQVGATAKAISGGKDVAANAQKMIDLAATIPAVFAANEISGDSKSLPAIWTNMDDFNAKANGLSQAASAVLAAANGGGDVAGAAKAMGGACGACHKLYKAPN